MNAISGRTRPKHRRFVSVGAIRLYARTTRALFECNADDYAAGAPLDTPEWRELDGEQAMAAAAVPRWMRRHIDSHVARRLGWDDRTGWTS